MRSLIIVGIVVGMTVLGGCNRAERASVDQQVRGAAENVRQATNNAALATKVKTALATRKGLDGADIHVDANGSAVTLTGDVKTREQADLAEQVARETDGVTTVTNRLMLRVPAKGSSPATPG